MRFVRERVGVVYQYGEVALATSPPVRRAGPTRLRAFIGCPAQLRGRASAAALQLPVAESGISPRGRGRSKGRRVTTCLVGTPGLVVHTRGDSHAHPRDSDAGARGLSRYPAAAVRVPLDPRRAGHHRSDSNRVVFLDVPGPPNGTATSAMSLRPFFARAPRRP